ncbi:MAG: hypothetical protein HY050_09010 [Actinobacteria bacterium]|nr:hypothetical protein [Actinomycetota bacterium]
MIEKPELAPGDSRVQRDAEITMVAWLGAELGCELKPKRINLPNGSHLELDAFCREPLLICEAWAHQGSPKPAQKAKIMNDAMKLLAARRVVGEIARAILLFADDEAANHFRRKTWQASALSECRIEVLVAILPDGLREEIRAAQTRQFR